MNKPNYKNICKFAVMGLLVLLAICTLFVPLVSAKVNVAENDGKPYNGSISMSPVEAYGVRKDIAEINDTAGQEFEDLSQDQQIDYMYYNLLSGVDVDSLEDSTDVLGMVDTLTNPVLGMTIVKKAFNFFILFLFCAVLVGVIGNKAAYAVSITSAMLYLYSIVGSALSRAGFTLKTGYSDNKEFMFYDFTSTGGFVLEIILVILIVLSAAFAISLFVKNAPAAVSVSGPVPAPAPTPAPAPAPASSSHQIVCVEGEFRNASFNINPGESLVIGRDSNVSNIVVVAPKVSRKHCSVRFDRNSNCYFVADYSANGTFTVHNGARLVPNQEISVPCGTIIALGNNDNQFRLD